MAFRYRRFSLLALSLKSVGVTRSPVLDRLPGLDMGRIRFLHAFVDDNRRG